MLTSSIDNIKNPYEKNIDFYICKSFIKRNMDKRIAVITKTTDEVIKKAEFALANNGFTVTTVNKADSALQVIKHIAFVDCRENLLLLDQVRRYIHKKTLIIAIVNEEFNSHKKITEKSVYDYITPCFSNSEIINKVNLLLLYHAANNLNLLVDDSDNNPITLEFDKESHLVKLSCNYIIENLSKNLSIEKVCRSVGTNRNTLAKAFKNKLGVSVYFWLRQKRIEKANHLLTNTRMSIQHICFEAGYENAANFSTAFKAINGVSPNAYRKLHQNRQKTSIQ